MKKFTILKIFLVSLFFTSLSCQLSTPPNPNNSDQNISQQETLKFPSEQHLYFLSDQSGIFQVWKLELGNGQSQQLTTSNTEIEEYAVSPSNGSIAYITQNKLFLLSDSTDTPEIVFDGGTLDKSDIAQIYTNSLSDLAWSHDGNLLAYGYNGINIFDYTNSTHTKLIQNEITLDPDHTSKPLAIYHPISWSPDNSQLLINIDSQEGWENASYYISEKQLIKLGSPLACCIMLWLEDNQSVLGANPFVTFTPPGLWHYNTRSGVETAMIPTTSAEGTLNFVGWPKDMSNGNLRFFYTNTAAYPELSPPLIMVEASLGDLNNPTPLRPESWPVIEALWAGKGDQVAIVQSPLGETDTPFSGPIILVDILGNPPIPLAANGYNLQWGP